MEGKAHKLGSVVDRFVPLTAVRWINVMASIFSGKGGKDIFWERWSGTGEVTGGLGGKKATVKIHCEDEKSLPESTGGLPGSAGGSPGDCLWILSRSGLFCYPAFSITSKSLGYNRGKWLAGSNWSHKRYWREKKKSEEQECSRVSSRRLLAIINLWPELDIEGSAQKEGWWPERKWL